MKIQLIREREGKQNFVRSLGHSEDVIIQKTRVKILNQSGQVEEMYVLEGLGELSWLPIETTGNFEVSVKIFVGPTIEIKHPSQNLDIEDFQGRPKGD